VKFNLRSLAIVFGVAAALTVAQSAHANTIYNFVRITNTNVENVGAQMQVEVIDVGGNQVAFEFKNAVGTPSSITDIYFDDGSLLGISNVTFSAGVDFSALADPANLPSANSATPSFITSAGFSADSNPPRAPNGVNSASEWVRITFNLKNGKTFADTIAALDLGLTDGGNTEALRIGLHVQAIGVAGESDSYINGPPNSGEEEVNIPDGGMTISLLGLALSGMGLLKRRLG